MHPLFSFLRSIDCGVFCGLLVFALDISFHFLFALSRHTQAAIQYQYNHPHYSQSEKKQHCHTNHPSVCLYYTPSSKQNSSYIQTSGSSIIFLQWGNFFYCRCASIFFEESTFASHAHAIPPSKAPMVLKIKSSVSKMPRLNTSCISSTKHDKINPYPRFRFIFCRLSCLPQSLQVSYPNGKNKTTFKKSVYKVLKVMN